MPAIKEEMVGRGAVRDGGTPPAAAGGLGGSGDAEGLAWYGAPAEGTLA